MALAPQKQAEIAGQYDPIRERAKKLESANLQGQRDQLARNQARLGGAPSGAFVKQEQMAGDQSAERLQTANEGIDAQQMAAINQARDIQEGREYQTAERLGSQTYATGERQAGQEYGTGERLASQTYASAESALGRKSQEAQAKAQLKQQADQFGQTFAHTAGQDKFENEFNAKTGAVTLMSNLKTAGYSPDQIGSLWKELGLESLGVNLGEIQGFTAAPTATPTAGPTLYGGGTLDVSQTYKPGWVYNKARGGYIDPKAGK